jgi:hypothetical protein
VIGRGDPATGERTKSWVCPWWDQTLAPGTVGISRGAAGSEPDRGAQMYTEGSSARRGQSWHRRVSDPTRESIDATASNLDTSLDRGRSRSVHAVEFSKTVAPLQEGNPPQGRARVLLMAPGRTDEYSAPRGGRRVARPFPSGPSSTAAVKIAPER